MKFKKFNGIRSLGVLKREYLEEAVASLSLSPFLTALFNLFIIFLIIVKRSIKRLVRRQQRIESTISSKKIDKLTKTEYLPSRMKVLLVVEESIPHCFRYRVQQKIEQLELMNYDCEWISWKDSIPAANMIHFNHVIIFYRVPGFDSVIDLMNLARALKKAVIFDVDDLIFDKDIMEKQVLSFKNLSKNERYELVKGAELYSKAIEMADFLVGSTPSLCNMLESYAPNVFLHRNGLDSENVHFLNSLVPKKEKEFVSIIYGSGTNTHNADFKMVAPALIHILGKFNSVRLIIIGNLDISDEFNGFKDRVVRIPMVSNYAYMELLKDAEICIAPLEEGVFTDSKSEIKWLEAAVFKVPSIVSNTITYKEIIVDGKNGFIASSLAQWVEKLSLLVTDSFLRNYIGNNAFKSAQDNYMPDILALNLDRIIRNVAVNVYSDPDEITMNTKTKIVFVNVLYPPYALGGATVMVVKHIDIIKRYYGSEFDISVVTTNPEADPYEVLEYEYDGIHVFSIGIPPGIDMDWRYNDEIICYMFKDYISLKEPDIIHFHSIQRLSGSILKAAWEKNIPFTVTLHDSWWLCDRQFMITGEGTDCEQFQVDPFVCAECIDDSDGSIRRRVWLSEQLGKADYLFAVSEYQKRLYEANGFTNVVLNYNGISVEKEHPKRVNCSNKLILGYAGGICHHKGYYFLKKTILQSDFSNIEIVVIDIVKKTGSVKEEKWGNVVVKRIPAFPIDKMNDFYTSIDLLIVPSVWRESFGLTVREALSRNLWVVASDAGALSEDIQDGINGNVFEKGNGEELLKILKKIDATPDFYRCGNKSFKNNLRTVEDQVKELVEYYRKIRHFQNTTIERGMN